MQDLLITKDPTYRIYLIDIGDSDYTSIQMKNTNSFKYFKNSVYLIDFLYEKKWFTIEIETKDHEPNEFIKYFHTIICIAFRKQLIKRGLDGTIDFKKIPFALSYIYLTKVWWR